MLLKRLCAAAAASSTLVVGMAMAPASADSSPIGGFDGDGVPWQTDTLTSGSSKALCRGAEAQDTVGDEPLIDVVNLAAANDCATGSWAIVWDTAQPWSLSQLAYVDVYLDVDGNPANGCQGWDYVVGGDATSGGVFRIPSCEGDWPFSGDAAFIHDDGTKEAGLGFAGSAIGSPTGAVSMFLRVESTATTVGDEAPDGFDLVVPPASSTPPPSGGPTPVPGSFSNGRCDIPLDPTVTNNSVARLYEAYFRRDADVGGLNYWVPKYRSGELCLTDISEYFAGSAEFVGTYGMLGIPEFVRLVYVNVMGREPDPAGYQYWAGQLAGGLRRGTMMVGFSESPEFRSITGLP